MRGLRLSRQHSIAGHIARAALAGIAACAFAASATSVSAQAKMTDAQASAESAPAAVPGVSAQVVALVDRLSDGQEKVTGTRPGPDGLTGIAVEGRKGTRVAGHRALFWLLPGGKLAAFGPVFDMQGQNLTQIAMAKAGMLPHNHTSLAAWKPGSPQRAVIRAMMDGKGYDGFTQGHGPNRVTAFIDPNCIFCHKWWASLQATKDWQQHFTIRWIPVAFLKPSSTGKAAALLAGGVAALNGNETHFNVKTETGAIAPSTDAKLIAEAKANTKRWGHQLNELHMFVGTPTLVSSAGQVFAGDRSLASLEQGKS